MKKIFSSLLAICLVMSSGTIMNKVTASTSYGFNIDSSETKTYGDITFKYFDTNENISYIEAYDSSSNITEIYIKVGNVIYLEKGSERIKVMEVQETIAQNEIRVTGTWTSEITVAYNVEIDPYVKLTASLILGLLGVYNVFISWSGLIAGAIAGWGEIEHFETVRVEAKYREYVGCAMYKHYLKQIAYKPNSSIKKIVTTDDYVFTGVENSPENPPACREAGF